MTSSAASETDSAREDGPRRAQAWTGLDPRVTAAIGHMDVDQDDVRSRLTDHRRSPPRPCPPDRQLGHRPARRARRSGQRRGRRRSRPDGGHVSLLGSRARPPCPRVSSSGSSGHPSRARRPTMDSRIPSRSSETDRVEDPSLVTDGHRRHAILDLDVDSHGVPPRFGFQQRHHRLPPRRQGRTTSLQRRVADRNSLSTRTQCSASTQPAISSTHRAGALQRHR